MTKAKDYLLAFKESIRLSTGQVPTDMMPIINDAWKKRFDMINKNKNAISNQGWNPLNRALLLNEELRATMTTKEYTPVYSTNHNIHPPRKFTLKTSHNNTSTETGDESQSTTTLCNNLPIMTDELNTATGTAGACMKALISLLWG